MLKPTMRKLYVKLVTLGILAGCLWWVSSPRSVRAFATCESCSEAYAYAMHACDQAYDDCTSSPAQCQQDWQNCFDNASSAASGCFWGCTWADPGGSHSSSTGVGGRLKNPCQRACYSLNTTCFAHDGVGYVDDCLNEGGTVVGCCHQAFVDCMGGC
jgi:hypothetical protein